MKEPGKTVVLVVGEDFHLKTGKDHIIYAGMPSAEVYSIAQKKGSGYQGFAWNLYFPKKRQDITIDGVRLSVEMATPEEIRFRVVV
ncbi:MAG: hypothetical protein A2Z29_05690 [Chloroflexi bacterium RBG_16_56_11]|nr:MAG: hypothetical protein A2Z29_05690 [Chloroflexi bacterium RBG_16_56_11]